MSIFGFTIVRTKTWNEVANKANKYHRIGELYRWFAGWKDLDIIWEYITADTYYGDISCAREKYAKARGTTVYGEIK